MQWLHANKISINIAKTEVIIFRRKKKQLDFVLNLKIMLEKTPSIKLCKISSYIFRQISWLVSHINHLSQKLVKANAMLCKLCHYVNEATIKSIYHTIFLSHLSYVSTAWGQNLNPKHCITFLQKKAIWIISFAQYDVHTWPIFVKLNIIRFPDLISLCNCSSINIFLVRLLQFF